MATLCNDYFMVATHHFTISILFYRAQHNDRKKGKGYQGIRAIEALSMKIRELTSNVAITKKN